MSTSPMSVPGPTRELPAQLPQVAPPDPKTIADAVRRMHDSALRTEQVIARLERVFELGQEPPDMHTVVLNASGAGAAPYAVTDIAHWEARSLGILNPTDFAIAVGIGGVSVSSNSRAVQCPPQAAMVLPLRVWDIELGSPANLGATPAVIYVFRYRTLQPLMLGGMS